MYNRSDPRFRRTINQITSNLESTTESAQVGIASVTENYLRPCLSSLSSCLQTFCATHCATCFPGLVPHDDRGRPRRFSRSYAGPEYSFDFYDDWEEDETAALLSLGNDEYDQLLAGEDAAHQPGRRRQIGMDYGSRGEEQDLRARNKRRFTDTGDSGSMSGSTFFGFLNKLPFKQRKLAYKPSAEGLKDRKTSQTGISSLAEDAQESSVRHSRKRSDTIGSALTMESHSSRGDIFPSDDEDAVALDDDLAGILDETSNHSGSKSSKSRSHRPSIGKSSSGSNSSRSSKSLSQRPAKQSSSQHLPDMGELPTISDLRAEEQKAQAEEEAEIEHNRTAAQQLAAERGLAPAAAHDDGSDLGSSQASVAERSSSSVDQGTASETAQNMPEDHSHTDDDAG